METNTMMERRAQIFNVQKYSIYDGPGIRTLIFFKGCPLRCQWCSNPEGLRREYQVMYQKDFCVHCGQCVSVCPASVHEFDGKHSIDRKKQCIGCRKCEEICPGKALKIAGQEVGVSEVLDIVMEDQMFYSTSGGGVTLGGGELLMQSDFAANLLMECRRKGIHTAIETSGYAPLEAVLQLAEYTDYMMFDLKHIDSERHHIYTGVRNELILENLEELLNRRFNVKIRMPLLKGINDDNETIQRSIDFLKPYKDKRNFLGVDLLPYHKMGVNKYGQLDMDYPITDDVDLSEEDLERIEGLLLTSGMDAKIIRH